LRTDEVRRLGHELANALTALAGNLDVLRSTLRESGPGASLELAEEASRACARATEIAREMSGQPSVTPDGRHLPASPATERTILLCEDVDSIRRSTRMVLRSHGYRVLDAATGADARTLAGKADGIDLLVTDIELSDGSGAELAAALAVSQPGLRVLYVSGHTVETIELPSPAPRGRFLGKPFSSDTLLRNVREMLDP
jgi:CheY-like chemotaxis protein